MRKKRQHIQFLTEEEVGQIIRSIPKDSAQGLRDRALISALFSTGLRISEALALTRDDASVFTAKETEELSIIGKGGWQRTIYFSLPAQVAIREYMHSRTDYDSRLFPMGARMAQLMIKKRGKNAGFPGCFPHLFRHSFVCNFLKKGVSLYYIKELAGHRALSSTAKYLHTTNKELREIHKKIYQ